MADKAKFGLFLTFVIICFVSVIARDARIQDEKRRARSHLSPFDRCVINTFERNTRSGSIEEYCRALGYRKSEAAAAQ